MAEEDQKDPWAGAFDNIPPDDKTQDDKPGAATTPSASTDDKTPLAPPADPWAHVFSLTPQTPTPPVDPDRDAERKSSEQAAASAGSYNPLTDWKSWLPAAGAGVLPFAVGAAMGPPGWAADVGLAALGAAGGSVWKQALENDPQKDTGAMVKEAGVDALTQGAIPELGAAATSAVLNKVLSPTRLYKTALRPEQQGLQGSTTEAGKAIRGGLEGKIVLGEGAQEANQARLKTISDQIEKLVDGSNAKVSPQQYLQTLQNSLDGLRTKWGADPIQGREFVDQIDNYERSFLLNHGNVQPATRTGIDQTVTLYDANGRAFHPKIQIAVPPEDMTLAELRANAGPIDAAAAQDIKQQAYRTINANKASAWDQQVQSGVSVEARQEISSALRQDLEKVFPTLKGLNRKSGDAQALDAALEKYARRNLPYWQLAAPGALTAATQLALAGGHAGPGTAIAGLGAMALKKALDDPAIRSRIAIALYSASQSPAVRLGAKTALKVGTRAPVAAGKILLDPQRIQREVQQGIQTPQNSSGGPAKSDAYLDSIARRAYSREVTLNSLRR